MRQITYEEKEVYFAFSFGGWKFKQHGADSGVESGVADNNRKAQRMRPHCKTGRKPERFRDQAQVFITTLSHANSL